MAVTRPPRPPHELIPERQPSKNPKQQQEIINQQKLCDICETYQSIAEIMRKYISRGNMR